MPDNENWMSTLPSHIQELLVYHTIYYPGYDDACLGAALVNPGSDEELGPAGNITIPVVAYDMDKVANILSEHMPAEEAYEFVSFNMVGGWLGDHTPLHVWTLDSALWEESFDEPVPDGLIGIGVRCGCEDVVVCKEGTKHLNRTYIRHEEDVLQVVAVRLCQPEAV